MAHGEDTKDLSPMEYLGNLLLLIVGGNDTTRNTMSGSVYSLNKFPDQFAKLAANQADSANGSGSYSMANTTGLYAAHGESRY